MFPQLQKVAMMTDSLLKEVNDEKIKQLRDEKYIKKTVGDILSITGISKFFLDFLNNFHHNFRYQSFKI